LTKVAPLPAIIFTPSPASVSSTGSFSRMSFATRLPTAEFIASVTQNQPPSSTGPISNPSFSPPAMQARSPAKSAETTPSSLGSSSPLRVTPPQVATQVTISTSS